MTAYSGTVDRYILRALTWRAAAVIGLIVPVLTLENMPRLLVQLAEVDRPSALLWQMASALLPEYLAMSLPFAVFLGTALTFRTLSLSSELTAMQAGGLSANRLLRAPLLAGGIAAAAMLAVAGFIQPAAERRLDRLGAEIASGVFGFGIATGAIIEIAPRTHLAVDTVDPASGELRGVFLAAPAGVFTAAAATAHLAADDQIELRLRDGIVVAAVAGKPHRAEFTALTIRVPVQRPPSPLPSQRQRLDKDRLDDLLALPLPTGGPTAALSRVSLVILCLLAPILGAALGTVPPRRDRATGIAAGIAVLIAIIQLADGVRGIGPGTALLTMAAVLGGTASAAVGHYRSCLRPPRLGSGTSTARARKYFASAVRVERSGGVLPMSSRLTGR